MFFIFVVISSDKINPISVIPSWLDIWYIINNILVLTLSDGFVSVRFLIVHHNHIQLCITPSFICIRYCIIFQSSEKKEFFSPPGVEQGQKK